MSYVVDWDVTGVLIIDRVSPWMELTFTAGLHEQTTITSAQQLIKMNASKIKIARKWEKWNADEFEDMIKNISYKLYNLLPNLNYIVIQQNLKSCNIKTKFQHGINNEVMLHVIEHF